VPPITTETFADPAALAAWAARIETHITTARMLGKPQYKVAAVPVDGDQAGAIRVSRLQHGLSSEQILPAGFFGSSDYAAIAEVARAIDELVQPGARIVRGSKSHPVRDFHEAHAWLVEEAKKGRTIQRFKGLGEMNPEQLWETTVNPETRRLLQVRIEDAVAADQIFSTLMGDVVEPRRAFIEQNALRVSNLDV